jgi:hypothetical protein
MPPANVTWHTPLVAEDAYQPNDRNENVTRRVSSKARLQRLDEDFSMDPTAEYPTQGQSKKKNNKRSRPRNDLTSLRTANAVIWFVLFYFLYRYNNTQSAELFQGSSSESNNEVRRELELPRNKETAGEKSKNVATTVEPEFIHIIHTR